MFPLGCVCFGEFFNLKPISPKHSDNFLKNLPSFLLMLLGLKPPQYNFNHPANNAKRAGSLSTNCHFYRSHFSKSMLTKTRICQSVDQPNLWLISHLDWQWNKAQINQLAIDAPHNSNNCTSIKNININDFQSKMHKTLCLLLLYV
jgi:hypothetical protein